VTLGWGIMSKLSCISILEEENVSSSPLPLSIVVIVEDIAQGQNPFSIEVVKICLVGTHKPSIMLMSIIHGRNFTPLMNYMGTTRSGCVPNNVKLSQFDCLYILVGLKNGILLRYKWPLISTLVAPLSFLQATSRKHGCGE